MCPSRVQWAWIAARLAGAALFLVALLPACATPATAAPGFRSWEFSAGPDGLDEDSWAPLDGRVRAALSYSERKPEWPCGLEFGAQYARAESKDDAVASGADFLDVRMGAAMEWRPLDRMRLVCGAGPRLGLVNVRKPGAFIPVDERSSTVGLYAHAGVFVLVHGGFSIGLEGQTATGTDYDVLGDSRSAQSTELLVALRWNL